MVVSADVQDTTKLFEVISVTDSEVSNTGGGAVVSPSYVSTFEIKEHGVILNISLDVLLWYSILTGAKVSSEIKARDLTASIVLNADELTLIGDAWTQPANGVGVDVARDGDLSPGRTGVFLQISDNERLTSLNLLICEDKEEVLNKNFSKALREKIEI